MLVVSHSPPTSSLLFPTQASLLKQGRRLAYHTPITVNEDRSAGTVIQYPCQTVSLHALPPPLPSSLSLNFLGQPYQRVTSPYTTAACLFMIATIAVISTEASDVLPATPPEPEKPISTSAAGALEHQLIAV